MFTKKKYDPLPDLLRDREAEIKTLQAELKRYKEIISEQQQDCDASVDFKTMQAFSVERNIAKDGRPATIIGYYKDGKIAEWYIYCNNRTHSRLAEEFRKHVEARK